MMHCNGKCYLAKKLEQLERQEEQERSEHPSPEQAIEKAEFTSFFSYDAVLFSVHTMDEENELGESRSTMISQPHLTRVNAPPQV